MPITFSVFLQMVTELFFFCTGVILSWNPEDSWWSLYVIRCNCRCLLDEQQVESAACQLYDDWIVKFVLMTDVICTLLAKLFVCAGSLLARNHVTQYPPAGSATVLANAALIVLFRGELMCVLFAFSHKHCYAFRRQASWFVCARFIVDCAASGSCVCFLVCEQIGQFLLHGQSTFVCVCRLEYVS